MGATATTLVASSDGYPMYDRTGPHELSIVDEWDRGFGWQVAPLEGAKRTSHAIATDEGVWILDPLDAPSLDAKLYELGSVRGVAVCSDYHVRDAAVVAARHDVPVHVPDWCRRGESRLSGVPVVRERDSLGQTSLQLHDVDPIAWNEAAVYHPPTGMLYIPDILGTGPSSIVGAERLGVMLTDRLVPPRHAFDGITPELIRCGHGSGVDEEPTAALREALENSRRRFPRALLECGPAQVRGILGALME